MRYLGIVWGPGYPREEPVFQAMFQRLSVLAHLESQCLRSIEPLVSIKADFQRATALHPSFPAASPG